MDLKHIKKNNARVARLPKGVIGKPKKSPSSTECVATSLV